jgi:hypothetical protein
MIYRREKNQEAWHFCRNCRDWPNENFEERTMEPARLCRKCTEKNEALECEVIPQPGAS